MKILQVINSLNPSGGGAGRWVRNLSRMMIQQGNTVEVVCLDNPMSAFLFGETLCIHALGEARGAWGYHPTLKSWLKNHIRRFDCVILNGLCHYPGYILSKLSQHPDAPPYFIFPHGMPDLSFQRAAGKCLNSFWNWLYWQLIERHVIQRAGAVFFNCDEEMYLASKTLRSHMPQNEINVDNVVFRTHAYQRGHKAVLTQEGCSSAIENLVFAMKVLTLLEGIKKLTYHKGA